jgi:hypothetical protein
MSENIPAASFQGRFVIRQIDGYVARMGALADSKSVMGHGNRGLNCRLAAGHSDSGFCLPAFVADADQVGLRQGQPVLRSFPKFSGPRFLARRKSELSFGFEQ